MDDKKKLSVDFALKASWLAVSKMYNVLGEEYGITHSTGFVLLNIDKEHGTPATKIAPLMGMEARSLTRILKTLEENGWISRASDGMDRRKVMIKLTELGKEKREISRQAVKEFNKRVAETLGEEQLQLFFESIETIQNIVDQALYSGAPIQLPLQGNSNVLPK